MALAFGRPSHLRVLWVKKVNSVSKSLTLRSLWKSDYNTTWSLWFLRKESGRPFRKMSQRPGALNISRILSLQEVSFMTKSIPRHLMYVERNRGDVLYMKLLWETISAASYPIPCNASYPNKPGCCTDLHPAYTGSQKKFGFSAFFSQSAILRQLLAYIMSCLCAWLETLKFSILCWKSSFQACLQCAVMRWLGEVSSVSGWRGMPLPRSRKASTGQRKRLGQE